VKRKKLILVAGVLSLCVIWFVAVDWSWFVHDCPDCGHGEDVTQYRVLTVPIHETVYEFPSPMQQIATALGVPCEHPNMESWHKHRRWGLIYCKSPCINGLHRLTGTQTWYDHNASAKVVALAESDPSLKAEFAHRVFENRDYDFLWVVLDRAGVRHPLAEARK
jgi:hypothetical protein